MKILAWGTYDLTKPRVRILLRALRETGNEVLECHGDVWGSTEDKSQIRGLARKFRFLFTWLLSYPKLIWCLFRQSRPDVIFVGYLGQFDVLVVWPFARILGIPVVWDAFISLYNTVVEDRRMVGRRHPLALMLYALEWLATRAADRVILDTRAHADYFVERFGIPVEKTAVAFVGVEPEAFHPCEPVVKSDSPYTVLFYGQFIPLHGIDTIVRAARILDDQDVRWVLIGKGQEEQRISAMLAAHPLAKMEWISWVPYEELLGWIAQADVCLGIFDDGGKASRVIPNKVFQILAAGKPLVTRDSAAIRELLGPEDPGICLVPPADPVALAEGILKMRKRNNTPGCLHANLTSQFDIATIGSLLAKELDSLCRNPAAP